MISTAVCMYTCTLYEMDMYICIRMYIDGCVYMNICASMYVYIF